MSQKQIILYWSLWRKACRAKGWPPNNNVLRHDVHLDLLGRTVSSKCLTNPEFNTLIHAFRLWADPTDLGVIMFFDDASQGERKRLLYSIRRMMPPAYVRKIAVDLFDRADRESLSHEQLTQLRNTLSNRRRAQQRKGNAETVQPSGPPPKLRLRRVIQPVQTPVTVPGAGAGEVELPF